MEISTTFTEVGKGMARNLGKVTGIIANQPRMPVISAIMAGKTELWFHPDQTNGSVRSDVIQKHLTDAGLIKSCVRVFEIQDLFDEGIDFFRRYFAGMTIYGRAIPPGATRISFLCESCERSGKLLLGWAPFDTFLFANSPALRVFE